MHLKTRNEFPTNLILCRCELSLRYTRYIFGCVGTRDVYKTLDLAPRHYVHIQHFRSFSYYLHATNSLLQSIRLPLLTMHMLCLSNLSLKFSHGLTSG